MGCSVFKACEKDGVSYSPHILSGLLLFWVLLLYCTVIVHGCRPSGDSRTTLAAFASPVLDTG